MEGGRGEVIWDETDGDRERRGGREVSAWSNAGDPPDYAGLRLICTMSSLR